MIQENELRIGNWVMWQGIHIRIATPTIFERTLNKIKEGRVSGILLTPEILEKAGFEKKRYNDHYFCYCKGDFVFPYDGKYFFHCTYKEARFFDYSNEVEIMVHQLQNLCFALTGEELQIDL